MSVPRWLLRAAVIAFGALVGWVIYRRLAYVFTTNSITWSDLAEWKPSALPFAVSLLLLIVVYCMHALLWGRIVRDLEIGSPSVATCIRVYFVSGLGRYIPIKFVALAGLAVLAKRAGLPPASSAAAAILGQFAFLSTGLLFVGITLPEWDVRLESGRTATGSMVLGVGAALLIIAAVSVWLFVATPMGHGLRSAMIGRLGGRAGERLGSAFSLADRIQPRHALLWAISYALSWVLLGFAFVMFVSSFAPQGWQHIRLVGGTVAAAYAAGYFVFFLPAGLGMREAVMIALLTTIMPLSGAIVVSVVSRIWFTAAELLPLVALPFMRSLPMLEGEDG